MNLVLIGLRGSGKSTVGRLLAQRLGWDFFDTDLMVQERTGISIREMFEKHGEAEFRKHESAAVLECAARSNAVIATGGGAILNPLNTDAIKKDGFVAHLSANPEVLWQRISHDQTSIESRPKLIPNAFSGIDELKKLMLARAGAYAHARDVEVDVEERSPEEVADAVLILMRARGVIKPESGRLEVPIL